MAAPAAPQFVTRLRAIVRGVKGSTTHLRGVRVANELGVIEIPDPETVEVVEQDGAVYLLRLDSQGECLADTWHESGEAAKAQAHFELGVDEGGWRNIVGSNAEHHLLREPAAV